MAKVIVFGPTGNIGSVAARTAQEYGAKVFLGMRDTSKEIRGLSSELEKSGGFERVQADLSKPDTVTEAIKKTGATRAFIYVVHGGTDHMKATISAMKSAGIDFVVLLSSYTIKGDPRDVEQKDIIPFVHAQVEINLDEIYGPENYVAIRPGGFATNLLRHRAGIISGNVRIFGGALKFDCITPGDMGRVSGIVLANGPKNGQKKVYLYGPKEYTQKEGIKEICRVLDRDVEITDVDETEGREQFKKVGIPPPMIDYMISIMKPIKEGDHHPRTNYDEGVKNVELYTGKPSAPLEDWVKDNKHLFNA